ncbi:hypothetical protein GCM10025781_21560 [Kocuria gwangalliensis]|uniref:Uncharacterized protein n=1 Tax=Kocuria gwangalliensis TaxID=501592 RepID=A0ABP8XA50_9MICC
MGERGTDSPVKAESVDRVRSLRPGNTARPETGREAGRTKWVPAVSILEPVGTADVAGGLGGLEFFAL